MNTVPYTAYKATLPSETKLGVVHLKVSDLKNQVAFYSQALKLTVHKQDENEAILGDINNPLLHLHRHDNLKRYHDTTGMYHFALLYPSEKELAKAIGWLGAIEYPQAPTDHGMSKTTYLKDLEGNDIELYIRTLDRGQYVKENGILQMKYNDGRLTDGRDPLDLEELFSHIEKDDDLQSPLFNMEMGHIHLYGINLEEMTDFYTNTIGFADGVIDPRFRMGDVGLDERQNHVIAYNSWKNTSIAAPEDALGLDYYTIVLPDQKSYQALENRLNGAGIPIQKSDRGIFIKDPSHIDIKLEIKN